MCNKISYDTKKDANKDIKDISSMARFSKYKSKSHMDCKKMKVYLCIFCDKYHVTTKKKLKHQKRKLKMGYKKATSTKQKLKILIACEYSGTVRDAFIAKGHNAISCDLLPTESPGLHYHGDVIEFLNLFPDGWFDLIIAHPECTALCVSGNRWYGEGKAKYNERLESVKWTMAFWELCKKKSPKVCFENPVGVLHRLGGIPKATYVQPYQHGHKEQKKTGLHLHNLEPLKETSNVYEWMMLLPKRERERMFHLPPSLDRWKIRSTTYKGIAAAMAGQWG